MRLLGIEDDPWMAKAREKSEAAFLREYFDEETGSFCFGKNGADAFAISLGMGDRRTSMALISKYCANETLDTGILGTDILIDVLFQNGYVDLAFRLLTNLTKSSYEHMRVFGATTLWEEWSGRNSHNHPMFGGVVRSFLRAS